MAAAEARVVMDDLRGNLTVRVKLPRLIGLRVRFGCWLVALGCKIAPMDFELVEWTDRCGGSGWLEHSGGASRCPDCNADGRKPYGG